MKRQYSDDDFIDNNSDGSEYSDTSDEIEEKISKYLPIIIMNQSDYNSPESDNSTLDQYCHQDKRQKMNPEDEALLKVIRDLTVDSDKSILERIINSDYPMYIKKKLVNEYDEKEGSTSERVKFTSYAEKVLRIPVGKLKKINPSFEDIPKFILNLRKNLDDAIAGHNETKTEIIDYITSIIRNPQAKTNILALQSYPGCGKTKFVRALGKALDLPFSQISFGGLNDQSILTGHDYTYIGSKPGRIYDILCKSGYMNSVIMLDEIDKIGDLDSSKTKEVYGVLTHILDKEQNCEFYDNYIGDIPIDLSKILFIASFNNEYNVDPIVLNRMKVIKIKESSLKEKIEIVKKFTIPELISNLKFENLEIDVSDDIIKYVILNKTIHEPGMRNINKNFSSLYNRINTVLYLENASAEERQNITKDLVYENVVLTRDGVNRIIVNAELVDKFIPKRTSAMDLNMMYN